MIYIYVEENTIYKTSRYTHASLYASTFTVILNGTEQWLNCISIESLWAEGMEREIGFESEPMKMMMMKVNHMHSRTVNEHEKKGQDIYFYLFHFSLHLTHTHIYVTSTLLLSFTPFHFHRIQSMITQFLYCHFAGTYVLELELDFQLSRCFYVYKFMLILLYWNYLPKSQLIKGNIKFIDQNALILIYS